MLKYLFWQNNKYPSAKIDNEILELKNRLKDQYFAKIEVKYKTK